MLENLHSPSQQIIHHSIEKDTFLVNLLVFEDLVTSLLMNLALHMHEKIETFVTVCLALCLR